MLYLTLMKTLPERAVDQIGFSKRINSVPPPSGINIRGVYFSFGQHGGAILFEASNHRTAKEFTFHVAKPPICETETSGAILAEDL